MATPQVHWAEITRNLEQNIPITHELLQLLEQERESLESREYQQFQKITSQKFQALQQLEQSNHSRQQLMIQAGFVDEASAYQHAQQHRPALAKAWRQLGKQWQRCRELNEINERISRRTRLVVGQVLDQLRGQTGSTMLYTGKGNTDTRSGGQTITSA